MHRPFTLSIAFIIGSAILLVAAGFSAHFIGRNVGEASTIRLGTQQAEAEAKLIGEKLDEIFQLNSAEQSGDGATSSSTISGLSQRMDEQALESLFVFIDFHHINIFTMDGQSLWEIGSDQGLGAGHHRAELFESDQTVSWLTKDVDISTGTGEPELADLLQTFVPVKADEGLAIHFVVDITETLDRNVSATQAEIRNKTMLMLGGLLVLLALLVLGLDLKISKRNAAVVSNERAMMQELDSRNVELQRLDQVKNEFLSSLSHELKTPLAAILGFARILRKNKVNNLEKKQLEQLDIINRNGIRLDSLINDLLDLSRIQANKIKLIQEEIEISALLTNVVSGFETIVAAAQQSIALNIEHDEIWLTVDQARIAQVLGNLLSNASKYSPKGSTITVNSRRESHVWVVSVSDEGLGISPENQRQLFSLFYRTPDAVNSSVPGTGIGLFVSKQVVDLHGGEISLRSAPGEGTTVTMKLSGVQDAPSVSRIIESPVANTFEGLDDAV